MWFKNWYTVCQPGIWISNWNKYILLTWVQLVSKLGNETKKLKFLKISTDKKSMIHEFRVVLAINTEAGLNNPWGQLLPITIINSMLQNRVKVWKQNGYGTPSDSKDWHPHRSFFINPTRIETLQIRSVYTSMMQVQGNTNPYKCPWWVSLLLKILMLRMFPAGLHIGIYTAARSTSKLVTEYPLIFYQ